MTAVQLCSHPVRRHIPHDSNLTDRDCSKLVTRHLSEQDLQDFSTLSQEFTWPDYFSSDRKRLALYCANSPEQLQAYLENVDTHRWSKLFDLKMSSIFRLHKFLV